MTSGLSFRSRCRYAGSPSTSRNSHQWLWMPKEKPRPAQLAAASLKRSQHLLYGPDRRELVRPAAGDHPLDAKGFGGLQRLGQGLPRRKREVGAADLEPEVVEQPLPPLRGGPREAGRFDAEVADLGDLADRGFEIPGRRLAQGVQLQGDRCWHGFLSIRFWGNTATTGGRSKRQGLGKPTNRLETSPLPRDARSARKDIRKTWGDRPELSDAPSAIRAAVPVPNQGERHTLPQAF